MKDKIKIMLVEDDPFWMDHLTADLNEAQDIEIVCTATTKDDAIAALQSSEVGVILMDVNLSCNQLDGLDAVRHICSCRDVKVIMLTNYHDQQVIIDAFEYGAVNYITKANYEDIIEAIYISKRL
jgi:two-component system response regulator DevR